MTWTRLCLLNPRSRANRFLAVEVVLVDDSSSSFKGLAGGFMKSIHMDPNRSPN